MALAYLVAPAGHPNYGDELIVRSWLDHLRENHPGVEVWLDCHTPGVAAHLFRDTHPKLHITDTLWRLIHDANEHPADERAGFIRDRIHNFGTPRYDLGIHTLRQASTIHLAGGGYLNSKWEHHIGLVWGIGAVTEVSPARAYASGLGLIPQIGDVDSLRTAFGPFTSVSVRDQESADLLGLRVGLDDAFLAPAIREPQQAADAPDVIICIQSDIGSDSMYRTAITNARDVANSAQKRGRKVAYIEAIPGSDHRAYTELQDVVDRFIPFTDVWKQGIPTAPGQQWVTTRFHLHLLGAASGGEGVAVSVEPDYYSTKHRSLLDLGTGWSYVDTPNQTASPSRAPGFAGRAGTLAAGKLQEAHSIYSSLAGTRTVLDRLRTGGLPRISRRNG